MISSELKESLRGGRHDATLFLLLGALLFLPALGARDLWNPDEPRYFEVAREMVETGEPLVLQVNGRPYAQKPPLFMWLMAASGQLFGFNEAAARLPSAAAAIFAILGVYLLGRLFFSLGAARIAALAFATCVKILLQGHTGQIDMVLTCLVLWAVYFWARSWVEKRPRLVYFFYLLTALATLAKGPVGLLPPLLAILAFFAFCRDREGFKNLRLGRGLLLYAAVMAAWLVPLYFAGGQEYFNSLVFKQTVTRYVNPWHHFRPWFYYLTVLPGDFFPWIFFLPAAIVSGLKFLAGEARRRFLFALFWVGVTLLFFSVSSAKRTVYILTMYPAMALLVGAGLERLTHVYSSGAPRLKRHWLTWPAGFIVLLLAALTIAIPVVAPGHEEVAPMGPRFPLEVAFMLLPLTLAAISGFVMAYRGRVKEFVASFALGMALTGSLAYTWILPQLDVVKSVRPMAELLVARAAPDEPWAIYPRLDASFTFYTRRYSVELDGEEELRAFLDRPEPVWLLIRRKALAKLEKPLTSHGEPLEEVASDPDLVNGYLLFKTHDVHAGDPNAIDVQAPKADTAIGEEDS